MTERLFTPGEVDGLIPRLTELMGLAMERHRQVTALQRETREAQHRVSAAGGSLLDPGEWKARSGRVEELMGEIRPILQEILALGGATKDLDLGLVDFPARVEGVAGGAIINLCWKHGEAAVRFWHGLDEGYAQRRPLP
jgi:hypothetical protein